NDTVGIVDPIYNAPCLTLATAADPNIPVPGFTDPSQCAGFGFAPNVADPTSLYFNANAPNSTFYPAFNPTLFPHDLTRGGSLYPFNGHTDVEELALYVRDNITKGNWSLNLGLRGDLYNGLSTASQVEPRVGVAYNIKKTNTILRASYARTLESPFNENLVLSSIGCEDAVLAPLLACTGLSSGALSPGFRNEFHAGIEQAFGRYLVFSGEWISKYTHNGYDFSVLGNTPITFPIEWHNSKIPGYAGRVSVPDIHGFSALMVFSSVAARFFPPQIGGAGATVGAPGLPFRIDHDEKFNQTTHFQYQPWKRGPWVGFNWRYDSGLVAGNAPCYGVNANNNCPQTTTIGGQPAVFLQDVFGNPLSADQEYEAGFTCNGVRATPTAPIPAGVCPASQFTTGLVKVPAPNTEDDDKNPPRIASRNLFDVSIGHDNLFHGDKYKLSLRFTAVNLTNKYALYNFLSTFSGTHYVTPRTLTAEIGFHF
ncbi:MAG: TonB-dependent receptor, partial [Candidatus Sulfotelmatobacter sp.]